MTECKSYDVQANGIRIHYYRTGGDRPPLVLAHGITDDGPCWTRVARALQGEYDVIMPDARGHGFSQSTPPDGYTWPTLAEDLAAFIAALGLVRPRVMGHSMGAETAAEVAAEHPDLVSLLVLEDPPWRDVAMSPAEVRSRAQEYHDSIVTQRELTREELVALCMQRSPQWHPDEVGPWCDAKLRVRPEVAHLVSSRPAPWRKTAARITCPTLLLTGDPERGAIVTPEHAEEAVSLMPRGRLAHIAGAGHCIHRDRFDEVLRAVRAFLAQEPTGP